MLDKSGWNDASLDRRPSPSCSMSRYHFNTEGTLQRHEGKHTWNGRKDANRDRRLTLSCSMSHYHFNAEGTLQRDEDKDN